MSSYVTRKTPGDCRLTQLDDRVIFELPRIKPDTLVPVIEVFLK